MKDNLKNSTQAILDALESEWESVHGNIEEHIKDATTIIDQEHQEGKE